MYFATGKKIHHLLFVVHFGGYHLRSGGPTSINFTQGCLGVTTLWLQLLQAKKSGVYIENWKLRLAHLARCNYGDMSGRLEG